MARSRRRLIPDAGAGEPQPVRDPAGGSGRRTPRPETMADRAVTRPQRRRPDIHEHFVLHVDHSVLSRTARTLTAVSSTRSSPSGRSSSTVMPDTPQPPRPDGHVPRGASILRNYISGFTSVFGLLLLYPYRDGELRFLRPVGHRVQRDAAAHDVRLRSGRRASCTPSRTCPTTPPTGAAGRLVAVSVGECSSLLAVVLTTLYFVVFPLYLGRVAVPERDRHAVVPMVVAAGITLFVSVLGRACNSVLWALNRRTSSARPPWCPSWDKPRDTSCSSPSRGD
ncbi:hypothetical protein QJS66_07905 [Kocuria rhizophila]|nr:hypothetical protein QJS66_07905 [Kocuria rhizophila]